MDDIRARIRVGPDQTITGIAPAEVPPGEHEITIELAPAPRRQLPKRPLELTIFPLMILVLGRRGFVFAGRICTTKMGGELPRHEYSRLFDRRRCPFS